MTHRLNYSPNGFWRSLQISRARLHVYVEGRNVDSYVYGRICEHACTGRSFEYRVIRSEQIPEASGGGKTVLLKHYDRLRRRKALVDSFKGGPVFASIFFLDKDIDDLRRTCRRSAHVVYTPTYDIEGLLYRHGNIVDAVAASCSLDRSAVARMFGDVDTWRSGAMARWKDWLLLCCTVQLLDIRGEVNFRADSKVNPSPLDEADPALVADSRKRLRDSFGGGSEEFDRVVTRTARTIDAVQSAGNLDRYFKGKWLGRIVEAQVADSFPVESKRTKGLKSVVLGHLAASLDVGEPWAHHYLGPLSSLLGRLPD